MKKILFTFCSIVGFTVVISVMCSALAIPPAPPLENPIVDQASILNEQQKNDLAQLINSERLQTSHQIAILTIASLEGESLEDYSIKTARKWGIGEKKKNNGVLLLVALNDRKLRIEVGTGLEGSLTDARASRIIRNVIVPEFKQGDYYGGINNGVVEIKNAIHGDAETATLNSAESQDVGFIDVAEALFYGVAAIFMVLSWIISILARTKTWWAGGMFGGVVALIIVIFFGLVLLSIIAGVFLIILGLLLDYFVSKNFRERKNKGLKPSWWAGGTTLGGGGRGGGFGGGGFGGGGASGGW